MGIDDGIADLERHVASTPSAEGHLTMLHGVDKMPMAVNMQVSRQLRAAPMLFTGPRHCESLGHSMAG
jgi:hypothetical protein